MLFDRLIEKRVASFERELLQKYYAEVENMYSKMRGGTITDTISRP